MRLSKISAVAISVLAAAALVAGCGSSSSSTSSAMSSTTKTSSDPATQAKLTQVDRLQTALKKTPNDPVAIENLANAYVAAGSPQSGDTKMPANSDEYFKNALKLLEQAHQIKPNDPSISQNLVDSYLHAHMYSQAQTLLEQLVTVKGANANTYYQLALAAQNAGNFQTAINAWNQFIAKSPKNEPRIASVKTFIAGDKAALKQGTPAKTTATTATPPETATTSGAGKPDTKTSAESVSTVSTSTTK